MAEYKANQADLTATDEGIGTEIVADAISDLERAFARDATDRRIVVIDGCGARIAMRHGHLVIDDGVGRYRRTRRYNRATGDLRRIVILARDGYLTLDALSWCRSMKVAVIVVDPFDATLLLASVADGVDDARLRRAQAIAGSTDDHPVGLAIVQRLLSSKLAGEQAISRGVLERADVADTISELADAMGGVASISECRQLEASAAAAYFSGWVGNDATTVSFATRDLRRVPEHWLGFNGRRSVIGLGNTNRRADRPLNALLNYTFALAKAEAVLAATALGLDPGMGLLHLDTRGRQSMALDLLEPVRPMVERFVLDLVATRTFRRGDFAEQEDGSVILGASLRAELADSLSEWSESVAPHVESVAHSFGELVATDYHMTAPLTGAKRRAAVARVKARKATSGAQRLSVAAHPTRSKSPGLPLAPSCVDCGGALARSRHLRCPSCWEKTPTQSREVRRHRGQAISAARAAQEAWRAEHPDAVIDRDDFLATVTPKLKEIPLKQIMQAAGVTKAAASDYRRGKRVPHPSYWSALAELVGVEEPSYGLGFNDSAI
ncbi:MAG: CRISPR-associated endonuclease Cas1 [Acidimicrobiales bacterium]